MKSQTNRHIIDKYLREMNKEDLERYYGSAQAVRILLEELDNETDSLDTYLQVNAVKNAIPAYFDECNKALDMRMKGYDNYYIALYQAFRIHDYILIYIQQFLYITLKEGNWIFNNELFPKANTVKGITFISIAGIAVLYLGFALVFSAYLSKPIRKLASAAIKMSKGNLDIKEVTVQSKDEVGILAESFNKMNISIKQLVDDLKEKTNIERKFHDEELKNIKMQQLLKEAEFLALQSQINPHFLFNTLNIIARTAMFENAEITIKLIQSLSNLFRYNIGKSDKKTTLEDELQATMEYVYIQQYRFGDRITIGINCNIKSELIFLPRFTLQPLVENSIIHGLEPMERGGRLRIKILKKGHKVIIKMVDNGVGIPKEKIKNLMEYDRDASTGHTTGIGIANVMRRLHNYFNGEACFKILSKPGLGTIVSIEIPLKLEEGHV